MKMKIFYFVLFYVVLGTAGITLPGLINRGLVSTEVSIGLMTIVMSFVEYSASERIMQIFEEKSKDKWMLFWNVTALVVALILTIIVCIRISDKAALYISLFAYLLSCVFWWYQNRGNKNLENTTTLGGDASQFNE